MINLRLPEGMTSVTVFDRSYGEKDGTIRGLEVHEAREIMAHDPRIVEFEEGGPDDPASGPTSRKARFVSRVGAMTRTELFNAAKSLKVQAPANMKNEAIREVVIRHALEMDEDQIPLVVDGNDEDAGGMKVLPDDVAADPNRGNDGLGARALHDPVGAGGSTFSQGTVTPAPAAAQPAPAGLGQVAATGTTQPPFNQLQTETGVPAHDSELAPFPISVPPIDPRTGHPYEAGDPRIPATAQPIARVAPEGAPAAVIDGPADRPVGGLDALGQPIEPAFHADLSDADRARLEGDDEADAELDAALTPEEREARRRAKDLAEANAAKVDGATGSVTDANHGNDAEGQKSPEAPIKN